MVENDSKDNIGIDKNPSREIYSSVQETPFAQGCMVSGIIPAYSRLWYKAVNKPAMASGSANLTTFLSNGKSPAASMITKGNKNIL